MNLTAFLTDVHENSPYQGAEFVVFYDEIEGSWMIYNPTTEDKFLINFVRAATDKIEVLPR